MVVFSWNLAEVYTYVVMDLIPILFWVRSRSPIMLSIAAEYEGHAHHNVITITSSRGPNGGARLERSSAPF